MIINKKIKPYALLKKKIYRYSGIGGGRYRGYTNGIGHETAGSEPCLINHGEFTASDTLGVYHLSLGRYAWSPR